LQGILISIAGTKGGVGKTLTLAHFLKILGEMKKRVAVISEHHKNELSFLWNHHSIDKESIETSKNIEFMKSPQVDHLLSLKSKYDVILNEVSNDPHSLQGSIVKHSDACILLSTPEPLSHFLLEQQCTQLLKNNPQSFHIVFNRLKFHKEYEFLLKNMKQWDLKDQNSLSTSYIPEDQALIDDLMRRDVFHSHYLQRISGQSWRRLLESILRQQNLNQLSRSRAA